jgi:dephospho-CoA kinase
VYEQVVQHFGSDIVQADGSIDRGKLAEKAFGQGRTAELNGLVHPAVIAAQEKWLREVSQRAPRAVAIIEAALLFEAGVQGHFDKMVVVTCDEKQRVRRFATRAGLTLEAARAEVQRRMAAQLPEEEKAARADHVIRNTGTEAETEAQVEKIYPALQALAAAQQSAGSRAG